MRRALAACAVVVTMSAVSGCSQPAQGPPSTSPSASDRSGGGAAPVGLPSQRRWLSDVHTAMRGGEAFLDQRVRRAKASGSSTRLAVNLDIDNTALASAYHFGAPVPDVLSFARHASQLGVAVLFNTARPAGGDAGLKAKQQLVSAGYPVTEICLRHDGDEVVAGKQRCRQHFHDEGYTLIANLGNNNTDFVGGGYERAFHLPNYGRLS